MTVTEHQIRVEKLKRRVEWWARKLSVQPQQIRVQKMTNKWASCSSGGWVSFSEDLLYQSHGFQKYVIVHELLHMQVPNHGKLWKSFMNYYLGYHKKIEPCIVCNRT